MDLLSFLQWPAMMSSLVAAWLVASKSKSRRQHGFWWFMMSNVLWIGWGWHSQAYALIVLQLALGIMNIRGARNNDSAKAR